MAAVAARQHRASVRRALKQGEWDIHRLLAEVDGDPVLARMRVLWAQALPSQTMALCCSMSGLATALLRQI
jgi:hypothetical protein